jgi:hypothetical protein
MSYRSSGRNFNRASRPGDIADDPGKGRMGIDQVMVGPGSGSTAIDIWLFECQ